MKRGIIKALQASLTVAAVVLSLVLAGPAGAVEREKLTEVGTEKAQPKAASKFALSPAFEMEKRARKGRKGKRSGPKVFKVLAPQQALLAFRIMAAQTDISFGFPTDGCYARAHLMARRLRAMGMRPSKVWSFARGKQEPLVCRTPNDPKGYVVWGYHVAPTVRVRIRPGVIRHFVIDPSMFTKPVTVAQWAAAQKPHRASRTPYVCLTRFDKAPTRPDGARCPGSGYSPAPDPIRGSDAHALAVMKLFKPWEGRVAPKTVLNTVSKL
jgi:hypothetical protein